ncbi:MAG TPA: glycosyltransferase family 2 protein [Rubrivivax sp.]|nr:glycosyltransferase family 2 protein [Rubrivivax sp.]HPP84154.1 glycosyltransferase family 2 protein [Rubrivivax sp.]
MDLPGDAVPCARPAPPAISVVLPAYNEAANLPRVLQALREALPALAAHHEIVVVDDGSRDATPLLMQQAASAQRGLRYLRLSRNFGKEAALTAGIDHARGDVVVLMDADGQHPVTMLAPMLDAWRAGAQMVCAVRESRADEGLAKRVGTWLFYRLANIGSPVPIPAGVGDFRLMDRRVVDALRALPERNRFMKGLYAWVGFETRLLPYMPEARQAGRTSFSLRRLARLAFTGLTAFTNFPLRVWSGLGALIALVSIGYGGYIVLAVLLYGHDVPGWPTIVTGIMFFSGVQLLSIGILGEYIGRIFDEVKQRPVYLVGAQYGAGLPLPAAAAGPAAGTTVGGPALADRAHPGRR